MNPSGELAKVSTYASVSHIANKPKRPAETERTQQHSFPLTKNNQNRVNSKKTHAQFNN